MWDYCVQSPGAGASDGQVFKRNPGGQPHQNRWAFPACRTTDFRKACADYRTERVGQKPWPNLAQMALSWILRDGEVTSVLIGASKPEQILENLKIIAIQPYRRRTSGHRRNQSGKVKTARTDPLQTCALKQRLPTVPGRIYLF